MMSIGSLSLFIAGLVISTFGQSVLRVVLNSQILGVAQPGEKGEVMGIMAAITSASMVIGPIVGGLMFEQHHKWPFYFSGVFLAVAIIITIINRKRLSMIEPDEEAPIESSI